MTRGERIRQMRESANLGLTELADKIGVSKQTLYKYENDIITNIPSDKIEAIAEVCNVSPAIIMGWELEERYANMREMLDLAESESKSENLTANERLIIERYRMLPQEEKTALLGRILAYTEKFTEEGVL